jgi:hypothetical protein
MAGEQLDLNIATTITGMAAFDQAAAGIGRVQGATQGLNDTQRTMRKETEAAAAAIRGQRMATTQLGMQISQVSTQMASGTSVGQVFAQQIGDIGYALSGMSGKMGSVGAFLSGPWGVALSIAGMALIPLISNLMSTKDATEELEKAEKLKKDTTNTLRQATLDYNMAVAKTPATQRLAIQAMIAAADADMQATVVAQRGAQNRINAIRAEILAIEARTQAQMQSARFAGGAAGAVGAGAAISGLVFQSQATAKLEAAEAKLGESRKESAKAFGALLQARSRLVNFDQGQADAAAKPNARLEKSAQSAYEKAEKAAEKLRQKQQEINEEIRIFTLKDSIDFTKAMEAMGSKASDAISKSGLESLADNVDGIANLKQTKDGVEALYAPINRAKEMSDAMGKSFSDGIKGMITGASSFKDMMSNVIDAVISKLWDMFVVQQIVGLVGKGISAITGIPMTGKAIGGSVQSGQPYMVGERGPEMFVPSRSGSIVPNGGTGGGINISVDARGASDPAAVRQQVELGIAQAAPYIIAAAQNRTLKSASRTRLPGTIG